MPNGGVKIEGAAKTIHYPVTTRFWRGVYAMAPVINQGQILRRACDWQKVSEEETSYLDPTCEPCREYKARLEGLGALRKVER